MSLVVVFCLDSKGYDGNQRCLHLTQFTMDYIEHTKCMMAQFVRYIVVVGVELLASLSILQRGCDSQHMNCIEVTYAWPCMCGKPMLALKHMYGEM